MEYIFHMYSIYSKINYYLNMLKKIRSLLHIFSIGTIINSLHASSNDGDLYDNDNNGRKLPELSELAAEVMEFLNQNTQFLHKEIPDSTPQYGDTFDFIITGGGTAGATVAARLSEIPQVKVLLIEAGFHENLFMDIPLICPLLQKCNDIIWNYTTKSFDKACRGMKHNTCLWSAGKVVGGSSVLNFMIASRGGAEDYDRWAAMGNEGWAYKDVLKYFKKLETMDIPELKSNTVYHGTNGSVHITYPPFHTPLAEAFLKAGQELRYPLVDYNGKREIGFSYLQTTTMNGTRMSSNRAYLQPIRDRKNLYMTLQSTVTKVLIKPGTKRAIGVEFTKNGRNISVFASKEVILCAGGIKSPQLLMLSGIGPAKHLMELDIDVVKDAPVGENLMDHLTFYGLSWTINTSISLQLSELINLTNPYMIDFLTKRKGPFTEPGTFEALGFVNTKHPKKHSGLPDIELGFAGGILEDFLSRTLLNLNNSLFHEMAKYRDSHGWTVLVVLLKPKSRGRITLLANDINVNPEIVPNYFDHPDDVRTMIAGIRFAIRLGQTKTMQAFNSQLLNITYSGCNDYEYDSDTYWECAIRTISSTIYHYSGTCKMGAREDPTAVVDPKLKVIGIQGLRIADASIMPEIISGHLSIPVYMIAEKAADMIKEEWGFLEKL